MLIDKNIIEKGVGGRPVFQINEPEFASLYSLVIPDAVSYVKKLFGQLYHFVEYPGYIY